MNYVAQLTAPGSAAIAVLALHGPDAWTLIRPFFRSKRPLPESPITGKIWVGFFGEANSHGDEIILACPPSGWIELHCHGGVTVVRWLLNFLTEKGFTHVEPSELPLANHLNAQAWRMLGKAKTKRTAGILLDQSTGNVSESSSEEIASFQNVADHLIEPFTVALVGRPNVGKSSLLNALAGYQRSIVAPIPGTTRDLVSLTLALDGWPVTLTDTAGLRDSSDTLEALGIEKSRQAIQASDLVLYLIEPDDLPHFDLDKVQATLGIATEKLLVVLNKEDLLQGEKGNIISVSSTNKTGLEGLSFQIVQRLIPKVPKPGQRVPIG